MKYIRSHHWHWTRQLNHTTKDINEVTCEIDIWWKLKCEANKKRRWHLWPGSKDELLHPLVDFGVNLALHQFVHFLQSFFQSKSLEWREGSGGSNLESATFAALQPTIAIQTNTLSNLEKMHLKIWTSKICNFEKYDWEGTTCLARHSMQLACSAMHNGNSNKYILQLVQIHLTSWTNTFDNLDK